MSSVMKFDKINALDSNRRSEPYKEYFDKMSIRKVILTWQSYSKKQS